MLRWPLYSSGGWCGFNALVSAREGRWRDKVLPKDEAEAASSYWLHGKEAWHDVTVWRCQPEERRYRGGETEQMMSVGLTRILLTRKIKKIHAVDSAIINRQWRFKATIFNIILVLLLEQHAVYFTHINLLIVYTKTGKNILWLV
jgi:hypothetical protein